MSIAILFFGTKSTISLILDLFSFIFLIFLDTLNTVPFHEFSVAFFWLMFNAPLKLLLPPFLLSVHLSLPRSLFLSLSLTPLWTIREVEYYICFLTRVFGVFAFSWSQLLHPIVRRPYHSAKKEKNYVNCKQCQITKMRNEDDHLVLCILWISYL